MSEQEPRERDEFERALAAFVAERISVPEHRVEWARYEQYDTQPDYSELTPGSPWEGWVYYKLNGGDPASIELKEREMGDFVKRIAEIATKIGAGEL